MSWNVVWRASLLIALSTPLFADVITLKDGRVLEGEILQDDAAGLRIKLKGGALSVDRKDVASIEKKATPEKEYKERAAKLNVKDAAAQAALGVWAGSVGLNAEAVQHCLEAWKFDPTLKAASDELERQDYHLEAGTWKSPDDYYGARGYMKLDGHWYKPLEYAWRWSLKEVDTRTAARSDAKTALGAAQARVARTDAQKISDREKIERLEEELQKSETTLTDANSAVSAAESDLTIAKAEASAAATAEGSGSTHPETKNAVKETKKKLAAAEATLAKARKAVTAVEASIAAKTAELEKTKVTLGSRDEEKARAEEEVARRTEDHRKAEDAVRAASARALKAKDEWEKSK